MKKKKTFPPIDPEKISLVYYHLYKSIIDTKDNYIDDPTPIERTLQDTGSMFGLDPEREQFLFRLNIELQGLNKKDKKLPVFAEFGMEYRFEVKDLKKFISSNNKIDLRLATTIASIAYSTSRGIIYKEVQGTYFNDYMLPVLDPRAILPDLKD